MDAQALMTATTACLAAADKTYSGCEITSSQPISGGYSRLTFLYGIKTKSGSEKIVLQYVPLGSTGLVRVDRAVEGDLLEYLTGAGADAGADLSAEVFKLMELRLEHETYIIGGGFEAAGRS